MITVFLSQQDKNIQFENYDSGYQVISGNDKDDLETYLLKILPGQISMDQENEAVKAQAVILRTDIIRRMENKKQIARQKLPYTTYENSEYRKKLGNRSYQSMDQKRKKSVSETRGKVITYKNKLIEPYFHALSVGMTLDSREWFGKDLPYIREKESLSDIEAKDYIRASKEADVQVAEKFNGKSNVLLWNGLGGTVEWEIQVPEDSLYCIETTYYVLNPDARNVEFGLSVDGKKPFGSQY